MNAESERPDTFALDRVEVVLFTRTLMHLTGIDP